MADYQKVEYIESTGQQCVNINYIAGPNTKVIADFEYLELANTGTTPVFSVGGDFPFSAESNSSKKYSYSYGESSGSTTTSTLIQRQIFDLDGYQNYYKITKLDGTIIEEWSSLGTQTGTGNLTLALFCYHGISGNVQTYSSFSKAKLYSCKVYESGVLVRDLIPCYQISTGAIGLYDLVNDVFYSHSGTEPLKKGNDINHYVSDNPNRVEITFYNSANDDKEPVVKKYFDARNLTALNYTKNETSNADSIIFEIASQSGSISMFDKKDEYTFQKLQEEGYLAYNEVKIYKNGVEDAIMYLYSPQKDINSIQWQFTLSDLFGKYKEKQFLGLGYGSKTARDCLDAILGSGNYNLVNITSNDPYLDVEISNCYLVPDTMWNTLNKICAFALLQGCVIDGIPTFGRSL